MQKLTYKATKQPDGTLHVINRKIMVDDIARLPKGNYTLTIEKYRKAKSLPQLGYYFACLLPAFRNAALNQGWEFESLEEVDIYLKSLFADREIANKHTGEMIKIPALKRNMSTTEMMVFINQVRDWSSEFLGVYIPGPNEQTEIELK